MVARKTRTKTTSPSPCNISGEMYHAVRRNTRRLYQLINCYCGSHHNGYKTSYIFSAETSEQRASDMLGLYSYDCTSNFSTTTACMVHLRSFCVFRSFASRKKPCYSQNVEMMFLGKLTYFCKQLLLE